MVLAFAFRVLTRSRIAVVHGVIKDFITLWWYGLRSNGINFLRLVNALFHTPRDAGEETRFSSICLTTVFAISPKFLKNFPVYPPISFEIWYSNSTTFLAASIKKK